MSTQVDIDEEIAAGASSATRGERQPRLDHAPYRSSLLRHPTKALAPADPEGVELWSPAFGSATASRSASA